jgi:hypothetical protein
MQAIIKYILSYLVPNTNMDDDFDDVLDDVWYTVETYSELKKCMFEFIDGKLKSTPDHMGPLDKESYELIPYLKKMILSDFVTMASQPARMENCLRQREWVEGLCPRKLADKIILANNTYGSKYGIILNYILYDIDDNLNDNFGQVYGPIDDMKITKDNGQSFQIIITMDRENQNYVWNESTSIPLYVKEKNGKLQFDQYQTETFYDTLNLVNPEEYQKNDLVYLCIINPNYGQESLFKDIANWINM